MRGSKLAFKCTCTMFNCKPKTKNPILVIELIHVCFYIVLHHFPNTVGEGPGPNAYTLNHDHPQDAGTSLKSRASPFVYSGFQTNKFTENSNHSVLATPS